jgi:hypothetical protein
MIEKQCVLLSRRQQLGGHITATHEVTTSRDVPTVHLLSGFDLVFVTTLNEK